MSLLVCAAISFMLIVEKGIRKHHLKVYVVT